MSNDKINIAVFGSDKDHCSKESYTLAYEVGKEIALNGAILFTGGLYGVMEAASKGAKENGGIVVGILPTSNKKDSNEYCDYIIPTGIGFARSQILANSVDSTIVIDGGIGTKNEVGESYWRMIPSITLNYSGGISSEISGKFLDQRFLIKINEGLTPKKTVLEAIRLGENRKNLEKRLSEVNLDINIYRIKPLKYIRINPRNPISIKELKRKLLEHYNIQTELSETNIMGIYKSSNRNIGGLINEKRNELFNKNYFIQDLASVIAVRSLNLQKNNSLLDMCAARGFKTILASDLVNGKLDITAIDNDEERYNKMLGFFKNYKINAKTFLMDASAFKGQQYDRVLVDVPCSNEGMVVRYDEDLKQDIGGIDEVLETSQKDVLELAKLQSKLLQNGFDHLRIGRILVYSTCTLNKYENEEVISQFLRRNKNAKINLPNLNNFGINYEQSDLGIRITPSETKGFYFTRIIKL